jgi:hypothetical protein
MLFVAFGIELRPEWSALLMSLSSIIVATNAVLLKRVERELDTPSAGRPTAPLTPAPAAYCLPLSNISRPLSFLLPVHKAYYVLQLEHGKHKGQSDQDVGDRIVNRETSQAGFQK